MTFRDLAFEAIDLQFSARQVKPAQVKRWINAAELEVWNAADWVFKRIPAASLAIANGSRTPTMPADFGKAKALYDDNGDQLDYLSPDVWEQTFINDTSTGRPSIYTVINRQVYVGPTPNGAYTYKLAYRRRYAHFNVSAAVTAGVMTADTDYPLWDSEHHYLLVPLAIVCGARLGGDVEPPPPVYQEQADRLLASMTDDLVRGVEGEVEFWGPV